jgi:endonuclease/exonuclease/phosphatase family metal-dependent hydrolase
MKLLTVNMEGVVHLDRIKTLVATELPDTLCLQEAPDLFADALHTLGYATSFAPMIIRQQLGREFIEGVMIASRFPFTAKTSYYYRAQPTIVQFNETDKEGTISHPILMAAVATPTEGTYMIGTTHIMVTKDGAESEHQRKGITALLHQLASEVPHILCGDFNMPRGYNPLYTDVTKQYTDTIPLHYASSLDRNLHRLGNNPQLTRPIFDTFMVDYIFTQPPYQAHNVRLQFGVSDHAAVVADITRQ